MAIACPVDLDTLKLRAEIQSIYARVAAEPSESFISTAVLIRGDTARLRRGRTVEDPRDGDRVVRRRRESPRDRAAAGRRHCRRYWIRRRHGSPARRASCRPSRPGDRCGHDGGDARSGAARRRRRAGWTTSRCAKEKRRRYPLRPRASTS